MQTTIRNCSLCVAFAGAVVLTAATSSSAAPVRGDPALMQAYAGQQLTDVRWRRGSRYYGYRYRRGCIVAGGYHREMSC
jgi:hypothetical protein